MRHTLLIATALLLMACSGSKTDEGSKSAESTPQSVAGTPKDAAKVYTDAKFDQSKSFIVISKKELRLYVYADINGDTTRIAHFPVCLSRNKGQKEKAGDMRTPESEPGKPFTIKQIQNASDWHHDFGDGRGDILAYGNCVWKRPLAASASTAVPTTRTQFRAATARGASACAMPISSRSRRTTPMWACLSSSRPRTKDLSPSRNKPIASDKLQSSYCASPIHGEAQFFVGYYGSMRIFV